jgi:hypothetical protein
MNARMKQACMQIALDEALTEGDETVISIKGRIEKLNADLTKILEERIPEELRNEEITS